MSLLLEVDDLRNGYVDIVDTVIARGERVSPRGMPTREIQDAMIVLRDPYDALPFGVGRKINRTVGILEATQLIGGFSDPTLVKRLVPNIATMSAEPDGSYWGAYGRRIRGDDGAHQLVHVVRKLREDPDSRQAVVSLWDPRLDNEPGHRDYPCTNRLTFTVRRGKLNLSVDMRSNDVWLGLAADAFQFTQCQISVARALDVEVGRYVHKANSLHIYERDIDAAGNLVPSLSPQRPFTYDGIGRLGDSIETIIKRACLLGGGKLEDPTETEAAYAEALR